jgi:hypothetical protein
MSRRRRDTLTTAAEDNWIHHLYFGTHYATFVAFFTYGALATSPKYIVFSLLIGLLYFPLNATTLRPVLRTRLHTRRGLQRVCFDCGQRLLAAGSNCPACGSAVEGEAAARREGYAVRRRKQPLWLGTLTAGAVGVAVGVAVAFLIWNTNKSPI